MRNLAKVDVLAEELPLLQQIAEVLEILTSGLNDGIDEVALAAWRDVVELTLAAMTPRLHASLRRLAAVHDAQRREGAI